ncbi:root hair defective 3 GTP-binding protein-domain-containing protein [Mycena vulgaris]|nr:root hair defective 3 GTP-binding protein-domain-containing protein [Mycena vulgaris]
MISRKLSDVVTLISFAEKDLITHLYGAINSIALPTGSLSSKNFKFAVTLIVFTEMQALELTQKFRWEADAYYVEAKRSTVANIAQTSYWMYGVLVMLDWNETMTVLFNPLCFMFLLIGLASACICNRATRTGTFTITVNAFSIIVFDFILCVYLSWVLRKPKG